MGLFANAFTWWNGASWSTGTSSAYRPAGSLKAEGVRAASTGDYQAWTPE